MPFDSLKFGGYSSPTGGKRERSNATAAADNSGNSFCSICMSDALNVGNDVIFLLSVDLFLVQKKQQQQPKCKNMRGRERKKRKRIKISYVIHYYYFFVGL